MIWLGRGIAAVGLVLILLPLIGVLSGFLGTELPVAVEYAPTFVLAGILVFVVGMGIRTIAGR